MLKKENLQTFESGAMKSDDKGKGRYDLIDPVLLRRLAIRLQDALEFYEENNWKKGIPDKNLYSSCLRHLIQFHNGEVDEDHLAAAVFNIMVLMWNNQKEIQPNFRDGKSLIFNPQKKIQKGDLFITLECYKRGTDYVKQEDIYIADYITKTHVVGINYIGLDENSITILPFDIIPIEIPF